MICLHIQNICEHSTCEEGTVSKHNLQRARFTIKEYNPDCRSRIQLNQKCAFLFLRYSMLKLTVHNTNYQIYHPQRFNNQKRSFTNLWHNFNKWLMEEWWGTGQDVQWLPFLCYFSFQVSLSNFMSSINHDIKNFQTFRLR